MLNRLQLFINDKYHLEVRSSLLSFLRKFLCSTKMANSGEKDPMAIGQNCSAAGCRQLGE
jgi:hypothetical protein